MATMDARLRARDSGEDLAVQVRKLKERERSGERAPWICSHCHHGRGGYWRVGKDYPPDPDGGVPWRECPACQGTGRDPFREALELAAYCGHEAARLALGGKKHWPGGFTGLEPNAPNNMFLGPWLAGLGRWPSAPERGALAAFSLAVRYIPWLSYVPWVVHDHDPRGQITFSQTIAVGPAHHRLQITEEALAKDPGSYCMRVDLIASGILAASAPAVLFEGARGYSNNDIVRGVVCETLIDFAIGAGRSTHGWVKLDPSNPEDWLHRCAGCGLEATSNSEAFRLGLCSATTR